MTIAAGFICNDGLVLATDLEITEAMFKRVGGKSTCVSSEGRGVAVVGAGRYYLLAYACEQMTESIVWATVSEIVETLRQDMQRIYGEHIHSCFEDDQRDSALQMLIGVVADDDMGLWISDRGVLARTGPYDFVGMGRDLAFYIMKRRWPRDYPSLEQGVTLARETVLEIGESVRYCGKGANILTIGRDGKCSYRIPED